MNNNHSNMNTNKGGFQPQMSSTLCQNLTFQNYTPATMSDVYIAIKNVISELGYPNINEIADCVINIIQPQLSEYMNNANRSVAEMTGQVRMLFAQNQSLIKDNMQQRMQNERLKKIKRTSVRRFATDESGCGICMESGKEEIKVGYILIDNMKNIRIEKNSAYQDFKFVEYFDSNGENRRTMIPLEKLTTKKLLPYFKGFNYVCSSSTIANEFLADCISKFPVNESDFIPEFSGFSLSTENDVKKVFFKCNDGNYDAELLAECSETFQRKIMPDGEINHDKITSLVNKYLNTSENLVLFAYSVCGLISSLLDDIGFHMRHTLIISSPDSESTRQVCCYLKTYNKGKGVTVFDSNITGIRKIVRSAKDETTVFVDNCKADNCKRRSEVVRELISLKSETEIKPHNMAIISDNVQYLIPAEERICMTLGENFCTAMTNEEEEKMSYSLSLLMRYIIQTICQDYKYFSTKLRNSIHSLMENSRAKNLLSVQGMTSYCIMMDICFTIGHCFNTNIDRKEVSNILLGMFLAGAETAENSQEAIVSEFMKTLNFELRNDTVEITMHNKDMDFISGKMQIVVKDELILMEECTVKNAILSKMRTSDSVTRLEKALSDANLLHATNRNRYPCTVYFNGLSNRKDFIAVKLNEVADSDIMSKIEIKSCEEWFGKENSESNMIPLAVNDIGYTAYRKFDFDKSDNLHCFVTGQSGSGKTFYMTEFMVTQHRTTEQLTIVLDTSGSFTRDSIIHNLSAGGDETVNEEVIRYVDENFKFIDVEKDCIPVNVLKLGYPVATHKIKTVIYDIVSVSIQNMGKKQRAELKECIGKLTLNKNYSICDLYDIIEEKVTDSLLMQLEDVISPFLEYNADEKSWGEFLENQNGIIVISSDASAKGGSSLVDMLLMSLFYYQCNKKERHINIVIDEVQNQNCGKNSAIEKILREGRKFHLSLTYATQNLSESNRDKLKTMNGAEMKVYFKPDNISAKSISRNLGVPVNELVSMRQGECYIEGMIFNNKDKENQTKVIHGHTYRNFVK